MTEVLIKIRTRAINAVIGKLERSADKRLETTGEIVIIFFLTLALILVQYQHSKLFFLSITYYIPSQSSVTLLSRLSHVSPKRSCWTRGRVHVRTRGLPRVLGWRGPVSDLPRTLLLPATLRERRRHTRVRNLSRRRTRWTSILHVLWAYCVLGLRRSIHSGNSIYCE